MTKQEIDKAFKSGIKIRTKFYIRNIKYYCGNESITSKQFTEALKRFRNQYELVNDFGGLTEHIYTYKPSDND